MPKKRTQLVIAFVAILVALLAALIAWLGLNAQLKPVSVVEAAQQVPPMTKITAADLMVATVPKGRLGQVDYIHGTLVGALTGRYTVYGLYPGEMVVPADLANVTAATSTYDARLMEIRQAAEAQVQKDAAAIKKLGLPIPKGTTTHASVSIGPVPPAKQLAGQNADAAYAVAVAHLARVQDEVAVTLQINEQDGFALVHTGDRVTVFGTVHDSQKNTVAFGVANHVLVLGRQGGAAGGAVSGAVSGILVLALTPAQVERLMLSEQAGSLLVTLNPRGGSVLKIGTVTTTALLGGGGTPSTTYSSATSATQPGAVAPTAAS